MAKLCPALNLLNPIFSYNIWWCVQVCTCITWFHTPVLEECTPERSKFWSLWMILCTVFFFSFLYNNNQVDWINKSNFQTMFIPLYPTQREMNHVWAGCLRCLEAGRCLQSPVQGGDTSLRVLPEVGRPHNWVVAVVTVNFLGNVSNVSNIPANFLIRTRLCINISILWVICFCFGLLVNISRPTPTQ